MRVYSTCHACGQLLDVPVLAETLTHPMCPPARAETLLADARRLLAQPHPDDDELDAVIAELSAERPVNLAQSALLYASWGWPVFPLKPGQKTPATKNGFKDATTDPDTITAWWTKNPNYNIGLPTGHAFDVIDVDTAKAGQPSGHISIPALDAAGTIAAIHGLATTGSGGMHLLVKPTGDTNRAGIVPGIDYRGAGGYIVAPPSITTYRYTWTHQPSPVIKPTIHKERDI